MSLKDFIKRRAIETAIVGGLVGTVLIGNVVRCVEDSKDYNLTRVQTEEEYNRNPTSIKYGESDGEFERKLFGELDKKEEREYGRK